MADFYCKTRLLSGDGSRKRLGEMHIRKLLLVSDPFFVENGRAQEILTLSGAEETAVFSQVKPDPTVEQAAEATALMRRFSPDTVVALGGGSALDTAKAMVRFAGSPVHFVAIPTTSGSGSEVTDFAILTHAGVKHPVIDGVMQPDTAILDGELLTQLPKALIAEAGFDAVTHAVEAFVARNAGEITDTLASGAVSRLMELLPRSYAGDISVRQSVHTASAMAGMAFSQAGLGLCHAMAHALGGAYHIPHGRLNAVLLPAVMRENDACPRYAELARRAGIPGAADTVRVRNLQNALLRLRRELDLPDTLAQAGADPARVRQDREGLIRACLEDPCCETNPVPADGNMVRRILDKVTGHG